MLIIAPYVSLSPCLDEPSSVEPVEQLAKLLDWVTNYTTGVWKMSVSRDCGCVYTSYVRKKIGKNKS